MPIEPPGISIELCSKQIRDMENFVTEYGNALIALVCGGGLFTIGWNKYTRYVRWLNESKSTKAKVVNLEKVTVETESSVYEMDRPTFRYSTTGEILVSKARQLFPLGELKTGDSHTVRYNSRTPGRILSDQAKNLPLMYIYGVIFLGGALVVLSLLLFLI
jgi:hypothetical protein